ncbi:MAG: ATP phosphoribosyltransferase [Bacteroidales bacterium]
MSKLKIAIQKSGRLHDDSIKLLNDCGISIDNSNDQLKAQAREFPLEVLYLRNSDIPQYLHEGVVDLAIIGENLLIEKQKDIEIVERLGFAKCRLSIAIPNTYDYQGIESLNGKSIATSYPASLQAFLDKNSVQCSIHNISGSVEIAPNIGVAEAICDLVSSGSTLFKNGLKEVEVLLTSEACLVKYPGIEKTKQELLDELSFRIRSVLMARNFKYILLNVPNEKIEEISKILPVLKSPTVLPLYEKGWSSMHAVIEKKSYWQIINRLKAAGAQGILVIPIDGMIL